MLRCLREESSVSLLVRPLKSISSVHTTISAAISEDTSDDSFGDLWLRACDGDDGCVTTDEEFELI